MDKRIGAQLYTIRDFCKTAEDFDSSMKKVSEIGYKTVQVSGIGPIPAETVKEITDKYGLEIVCTHKGYADYTDNLDKLIADHKTMGCNIAGLGAMPQETRNDPELFVRTINPIAQKIKESGLQFAYHNHAFEFTRMSDGKYIMDYLLENTDADNFKLIVDVYWLAMAGINPSKFIEENGARIAAVHFKDLAVENEKSGIMAAIGEGNLDWDDIISSCEKAGVEYALVEQDICPRDPFDCFKASYNNLTAKGFI